MDQASLIEQLKIERPAEQPPRRFAWWGVAAPVLVVAIGAAFYAFLPRAVLIQVAVGWSADARRSS